MIYAYLKVPVLGASEQAPRTSVYVVRLNEGYSNLPGDRPSAELTGLTLGDPRIKWARNVAECPNVCSGLEHENACSCEAMLEANLYLRYLKEDE